VFNFYGVGYRNFPNFSAVQAGGLEPHGVLLDEPIFANGLTAPASYVPQMTPQDVTLSAASGARRTAVSLPNINDALSGVTPDLGAVQAGCPNTIYGPRPIGVDETNQSFGCDVPVSVAGLAAATISPGSVFGGESATGTVILSSPSGEAGAVVALATSNPGSAAVPVSVTVPAFAISATFAVTTTPVAAVTPVTLTASYLGVNIPASLTVNPAPVSLTGLSANPTTIAMNGKSTGAVTLSAPAPSGGVPVTLASSNSQVATVPATVTIPGGATSATFTIRAGNVKSGSAMLKASYAGVDKVVSIAVDHKVR
jgi:hypothetical protein